MVGSDISNEDYNYHGTWQQHLDYAVNGLNQYTEIDHLDETGANPLQTSNISHDAGGMPV